MKLAKEIIEYLEQMSKFEIEINGEQLEYLIDKIGMRDQMLRQLMMKASDLEINNILEERNSFHDRGNNTHLTQN